MTSAEEICRCLNLNPHAGLGWRLCRAQIRHSRQSSGLYYIAAADDVETSLLAEALSVRAAMVSPRPLRFVAASPFLVPNPQSLNLSLQLRLQQPVHLSAHPVPLFGFEPV